MGDEVRDELEEIQRDLGAMTPEESLKTAAFIRDGKHFLRNDRQRRIAEDMACRFEQRAAEKLACGRSP